jgi:hypothetical protein
MSTNLCVGSILSTEAVRSFHGATLMKKFTALVATALVMLLSASAWANASYNTGPLARGVDYRGHDWHGVWDRDRWRHQHRAHNYDHRRWHHHRWYYHDRDRWHWRDHDHRRHYDRHFENGFIFPFRR